MIKIKPFKKNIFNNFSLRKQHITSNTYITNFKLANELLVAELPIKNRKIALKRIFDFLNYVDSNVDENEVLTINKYKLEKFFTRKNYKKYMSLLSRLKVIYKIKTDGFYSSYYYQKKNPRTGRVQIYSNGKFLKEGDKLLATFATKYKLHKDYTGNNELAIVMIEGIKKNNNKFSCEIEELDQRYKNTIRNINLNIPLAIMAEVENWKEKELSLNILRKRISRILSTMKNRKIKKGQKVDRIYHSFSNISKTARQHFCIKFYNLDIVNSQPLLLVAYLKKNKLKVDPQYQFDCENGNFYERFYNLSNNLNTVEEKRNKTKNSLYKSIFFGFYHDSKYNKKFKKLYPITWKSLKAISKTDVSLASRLQNLEASLFNKLIPKYSKYFFTLFDAIYYTNKADQKELTKNIKDFFKNLKIEVQVK